MPRDAVYCLAAALAGFVVGCALFSAGQPLPVVRPSVDMAVQYKPALASQLNRRAMMAGSLGLGVAANNKAAVAAPGTPEFRGNKIETKVPIPGIPKTADGEPMPATVDPGFMPALGVFTAVFTRIGMLTEKISPESKAGR